MSRALVGVIGLLSAMLIHAASAHAQTGTMLRRFSPPQGGDGRAVAFDGVKLYYTVLGSNEVYTATTDGVTFGSIPLAGRAFMCGALAWDATGSQLWCGAYDGTGRVYTIDPTTGVATLRFTQTFADDSCYGPGDAQFIDGLAFDKFDGTLWLSGDGAKTLYHVTAAGASLGAFAVPIHPSSRTQGCNTGITVTGGDFLQLGLQTGGGAGPHVIVKVAKGAPSTVVDSFVALTSNIPGVEDIEFDNVTFTGRCAVWTNEFGQARLTAYELLCAKPDAYATNEDTPLSVAAPGVLTNDTPGSTAVLVAVAGPGSVVLNSNGSFTYTPPSLFHGTASFSYKASNGTTVSDVTTVSITVNHVNHPPIAYPDNYTVDVGTGPLSVTAAQGVLANDTDADHDPLTAQVVTIPSHGTLVLAPTGAFNYTPNIGFVGVDQFTYRVSDGSGGEIFEASGSDVGLVTIKVNDPNAQTAAVKNFSSTCEATLSLKFNAASSDTFVIQPDFHKTWHCRLFNLDTGAEANGKSVHGAPGITLQITGNPADGDLRRVPASQTVTFDTRGNLCHVFNVINTTDAHWKAVCTAENSITDPTADTAGHCPNALITDPTDCLGAPIRTFVETAPDLLFTTSGGSIAPADQCPTLAGNAGSTGCPFAIDILVRLNKEPLPGANVRIFDRNDPNFRNVTGGNKNPPSSLYPQIYEADQGTVGGCRTDASGHCIAGIPAKGDFLVIVKFTNPTTGQQDYEGSPGTSSDFKGNSVVASKEFNIKR